jgi:hypothetical protein
MRLSVQGGAATLIIMFNHIYIPKNSFKSSNSNTDIYTSIQVGLASGFSHVITKSCLLLRFKQQNYEEWINRELVFSASFFAACPPALAAVAADSVTTSRRCSFVVIGQGGEREAAAAEKEEEGDMEKSSHEM